MRFRHCLLFASLACFAPRLAHAQCNSMRSVCDSRSDVYFTAHASAAAGLLLGGVILGNNFPAKPPLTREVVPLAGQIGSAAGTLELVLPVPALLSSLSGEESFDAAFTYGQALLGAWVVNNVLAAKTLDSSATVAFAAAVSTAYLFDQARGVPPRVQGAFWGVQLGLATAQATLDVRGGRRSAGAVALGATLGVGLGVLGQAIHSSFSRCALEPSPFAMLRSACNDGDRWPNLNQHNDWRDHVWAASAIGVGLGLGLPWLVRAPHHDPNLDYEVVPLALGPEGTGLLVRGRL